MQELESLLSDHFGRTPCNSQASEAADVECDEDVEDVHVDVEAVVEGRTRDFVHQQAAEDEVSDDGSADESEVNQEVSVYRFMYLSIQIFFSVRI